MKTLISIFVLSVSLLHARIGETPEECAKRYGAVSEASPDGQFQRYRAEGVGVSCGFADGKCCSVGYLLRPTWSVDVPPMGKEPGLSEEQCMRLLNLNGGGSVWVQKAKPDYARGNEGVYQTEDGKLQALVKFGRVVIETTEFSQANRLQATPEAIDRTLSRMGAIPDGPKVVTGGVPPSDEEKLKIESDARKDELAASIKKLKEESAAQLENVNAGLRVKAKADEATRKLEKVLDEVKKADAGKKP